jgi:hypothetical protein
MCTGAGGAREPSARAKPTASGEQTALARGRWANRSWSAAQWKQRVGSGVARAGAKAGDAGARVEQHVRGGAEWALERGCAGMTRQGWSKHGADASGVSV